MANISKMGWIKNAVVLFVWPGFGWVNTTKVQYQKYNTTLKQKLNVFPLGLSQQMSKTTENRNHEAIEEYKPNHNETTGTIEYVRAWTPG